MTRPLEGKTIALAEGRQLEDLAALLEAEGATPLRCPLVGILDAPDAAPVEDWLRQLIAGRFDWVVLMTGEADLRTPISQTEEFYRALKMLRKADTLMVRMPEEYHGWRRPSHQLLQQLYLMAWFEKYRTPASKKAIPGVD